MPVRHPDDDDVLAVAESLMDELATLHATYWGQDLPWLGTHALSPGDSPEAQERMAMGATIVQSALDQFADELPPEFRRLGEIYIARNRDIGALWNEGERTLIHGDNHIGNLFVDDGRTGFYDWAVASQYPGIRDVAYFLCNSLPTEIRRAEEDALSPATVPASQPAASTLDADLARAVPPVLDLLLDLGHHHRRHGLQVAARRGRPPRDRAHHPGDHRPRRARAAGREARSRWVVGVRPARADYGGEVATHDRRLLVVVWSPSMAMPQGIGAVDLMIGFPTTDPSKHYEFLRKAAKDQGSQEMEFPAEYMFKNVPDRCGVAIGMIGSPYRRLAQRALAEHPDRFFAALEIDPNDITGTVRKIHAAKAEHDIKAVTTFPAGCSPQVPVDDRRYYPIYQTCVDLKIPVIVNTGIAGPRVPSQCQDVMLFEQVCFDFPELTIVMRHGAEPWQELAVKLMVKWPNLYYMPSAFAPKHYPKAIIDYANRRGADRIMYAGYYPMGLSLRRIFEELPNVPFKDEVWPKFLRENTVRVFKLEALA